MRSLNWTDIREALSYIGYEEMCLIVRLALVSIRAVLELCVNSVYWKIEDI